MSFGGIVEPRDHVVPPGGLPSAEHASKTQRLVGCVPGAVFASVRGFTCATHSQVSAVWRGCTERATSQPVGGSPPCFLPSSTRTRLSSSAVRVTRRQARCRVRATLTLLGAHVLQLRKRLAVGAREEILDLVCVGSGGAFFTKMDRLLLFCDASETVKTGEETLAELSTIAIGPDQRDAGWRLTASVSRAGGRGIFCPIRSRWRGEYSAVDGCDIEG